MPDNDKPVSTNKRIDINDLSAEEKELTAEEAKKVKGGLVGDIHQPEAFTAKMANEPLNVTGHEMSHGVSNEFKK